MNFLSLGSQKLSQKQNCFEHVLKMETEVSAPHSGVIGEVSVSEGDAVQVGDVLLTIG